MRSRILLILLLICWVLAGAIVSYLSNDGFWFALAVGIIVIVGLAG